MPTTWNRFEPIGTFLFVSSGEYLSVPCERKTLEIFIYFYYNGPTNLGLFFAYYILLFPNNISVHRKLWTSVAFELELLYLVEDKYVDN